MLGGFEAMSDTAPLPLPTRKSAAILAYLAAAADRPVRRDALASMLWGGTGLDHARNNFRQALASLRQALGVHAELLSSDRETIMLRGAGVDTDITHFETLAGSNSPADLDAALSAYRGDFLAGFDAVGVRDFASWRLREAARLRGRAIDLLLTLLRSQEGSNSGSENSWKYAHRLLELDPLQEPAYRHLMRYHAERGQVALALDQYANCQEALRRAGLTPTAETARMRQALISKHSEDGAPGEEKGNRRAVPSRDDAEVGLRHNLPSLVVLPFVNVSNDAEQGYLADGLAEELMSALARISRLFVIARNSAFAYKDRPIDLRQIGRELGVRYVLEGSVRKSGDRIRVTCELAEARTAIRVWSERFDSDLVNLFDLQDRIAEAVAGAIEPRLREAEIKRAARKPTQSLDAYDLYLRALPHHYANTKQASDRSIALLRLAIDRDADFSLAKAMAAWSMMIRDVEGWLEPGDREWGARLATEALADSSDDPLTLRYAGQAIAWLRQDRSRGVAAIERALLLNPNSAQVVNSAAWTLLYAGRSERAVSLFSRAIRLSPLDPELSYFFSGLAYAQLTAQRYAEAHGAAERAVAEMPHRATGHRALVAALVALGRTEEARSAAARFTQACPSGARVFACRVAAAFTDAAFVDSMITGLRKAGLPE